MPNKVILQEVAEKARRSEAKRLRSNLFEDCRALVDDLEGDVSGYALVAWTPQGELRSVYHTGRGPIRPAVIPVLVQDALSRHVAKDMATPARISDGDV
jgi:hypothetical protein